MKQLKFPLLFLLLAGLSLTFLFSTGGASEQISVLIVDGQNNHQWKIATDTLKTVLENGGPFQVDIATSPPAGTDMRGFQPDFASYDVVLSNYNGDPWPEATQQAFESYVDGGGGFVVYHAADNAFPEWAEYNKMIGLGGWGDRTEKHGPYIRWQEGRFVRDDTPGRGGSHGRRHEFVITNRAPDHPIMKGLPSEWLHSKDELYDRLRGPAENLEILATAYSDPEAGGTGEHEPALMVLRYGSGRVFHTILGDNIRPLFNAGFQLTLLRGTEWAATGSVTLPVPPYFPTETEATTYDPATPYAQDGLGWWPLFNGKDLTGWTQVNGTATYEVDRDTGEIIGTTSKGSPNSFLASDEAYADFELRFEVKLDNPELNSGVQIRSHQYEEAVNGHPKGRVYGYQVEIEASRDPAHDNEAYGDAGFVYDEARRGWLSDEQTRSDPGKRRAFLNGEWNQYHIRSVGDRIETWINGVKIADLRDSETASGRIMLQVHAIPDDKGPWSVRWRKIFIRELQAEGKP